MALRHLWHGCVCALLTLSFTTLPVDAHASSSLIPAKPFTVTEPVPLPAIVPGIVIEPAPSPMPAPSTRTVATGRGLLVPMYVSFAALQIGDVYTTRHGLQAGAREANPMMVGLASNTAALASVKIGSTLATVYLTEKLRKKNRAAAYALMAALNGTYAAIVWHNSRVIRSVP